MDVLAYLGGSFLNWLGLFAAPFKNFEILWIAIPLYLNWISTEIWQEKKGTSLGNAISNGFVVLWVALDWGKVTTRMLKDGAIGLDLVFLTKTVVIILMLLYAAAIIIEGIRAKKITHYIGRIREVTYVCLMVTPIFYGLAPANWDTLVSILLFFPAFYFIMELICKIAPNPKTYDEDEMPSMGADIPSSKSGDAGLPDMGNLGGGGDAGLPPLPDMGKL